MTEADPARRDRGVARTQQLRGQDQPHPLTQRSRAATSEARHRDVADVAGDWIWETDARNRITFVSKRFGETSGIPWARVAGHMLGDLIGLGFDPAGMAALLATFDTRESFHGVVHRVAPVGGPPRFWRLSGKPFADPMTGAYAGYRGTGTDVTAAIEHETALHAALCRAEAAEADAARVHTRLVDAIEAIPEGFVLHDADDRLVLCNTRYGEIYGLTEDLMVPGITFEEVLRRSAKRGTFLPDGKTLDEWVAARLQRHRAAGRPHFEQRLSNGHWLKVVERRTSDGGIVGIRVDVTESRQREAAEREREKLAALGHLAGGVAHEINNLLQPAITLPELARDRLPPEEVEARDDLDLVVANARKIREIVRNILLFARREEPVLTPLDIIADLRTALRFVRDLMPPSVTVRDVGLDAHAGCVVAANKTQLTQVLTNLLVNAAQAMRGSGTVTVSVARVDATADLTARLSLEAGGPYLTIAVSDTGAGMDAATQARVFEPFFTTKPVGQGTGLGLSVVHGILRSWHGAITVDGAPGVGCTFTLYLPIAG